ncbi:preprotein translocase subunit SecG [Glacieibacterium frigidum]|uniref:Protein-export membrane protein SecG n=1 Tax=Glacieibacterium frigidum TaxID=2593303 RepID=A0A552U7V6_9SPHN|nr:preprotein translocase subunit SecG [Glacieibacterium frigidum]TRW14300.1 preprotein translocase subunit SecG [Glacieibacterium frigidum]
MATFILVVHTLIAIALCAVILMQRSEGGGLGIGGGGTAGGLMSARGAADLLTRATTILAALFIGTSITLAVLAAGTNKVRKIDTSLAAPAATKPVLPTTPAPAAPAPGGVPIAQ